MSCYSIPRQSATSAEFLPRPPPLPLVIRRSLSAIGKASVRESTFRVHLDPAGHQLLTAAPLARFQAVDDAVNVPFAQRAPKQRASPADRSARLRRMTSNAPQYAKINGIRIAYETTGSGFPLLMLHGFPRTHRTWEKVTPILAERFTLVMPDRRGYGDSDRGSPPEAYENVNMASDMLGIMDHLGIGDFIVVGHDKGMPTARRIAVDNENRVQGAVLLDGMPEGADVPRTQDTTGRAWYFNFFRQRGVAEQLIGQNPHLFFSLFLERNSHLTAEENDYYVNMFCRRGSVEAILADYRAGLEVDGEHWRAQAETGVKMAVPVLALWGGRGPTANAPVLEAWRQVAVNVRGEVVENSAHYVQEEQPEFIAERILAFADELGIK